jgi:4-alpha-glucanotransferase
LPGRFGIGDLGPGAHALVDWLRRAGQHYWQMLPLGPPDEGGSPYQSLSAFAGNPLLISPDRLVEDGLLEPADLEGCARSANGRVDYPCVFAAKDRMLRRAAERFFEGGGSDGLGDAFETFCHDEGQWLEDYALFLALRELNGSAAWIDWTEHVDRDKRPRQQSAAIFEPVARFHRFVQWQFARQWSALRDHAAEAGIRLVGDLPIYVSHDSADVWAHRDLFELEDDGRRRLVAGVPPDYFSSTGQLWNNPLYDWDANRAQGYRWWIERMHAVLGRVDLVRLDHFRGFEAYWAVPAGEADARGGAWMPGPGRELFDAIAQCLAPEERQGAAPGCALPLIAENLGHITEEVDALQHEVGLPGMIVLQFALLGAIKGPFEPTGIDPATFVYTGTHDNNTSRGWFDQEVVDDAERLQSIRRFVTAQSSETVAWELIELAWGSSAAVAIAPVQDVLNLPAEARMNTPGTSGAGSGNWTWRVDADALTSALADRLAELTARTGRAENRGQ